MTTDSNAIAAVVKVGTRVESIIEFSPLVASGGTGVPTDPTVVQCTVRNPAGTETTYVYGTDNEVSKNSTGNYSCKLSLGSAGRWWFVWAGTSTGGINVVEDQQFIAMEAAA